MATLDPAIRKPTEHFDFFLYGHFMKFIQRGAVRVESSKNTRSFANVAFRNPDGMLVLVVVNGGSRARSFDLSYSRSSACRPIRAQVGPAVLAWVSAVLRWSARTAFG